MQADFFAIDVLIQKFFCLERLNLETDWTRLQKVYHALTSLVFGRILILDSIVEH
jgi:hypothetical protein